MENLGEEVKNQQEVIDELLLLSVGQSHELEMIQLALKIYGWILTVVFLLFTFLAIIGAVILMYLMMMQIDTTSDVNELQIKNELCAMSTAFE